MTNTSSNGKHDWNSIEGFQPSKAPTTKWLWKNFLPERAITFVYGAPGSLKSTFALQLCGAISRGEKFMGHKTRQRRVLYLDKDNPQDVLKLRDDELGVRMEKNAKYFKLWSNRASTKSLPRIYKGHGYTMREIVRSSFAETGKPLLIVFDHWAAFLKDGDSGHVTGETSPIFQTLGRLCAIGATVLILGHTKKDSRTQLYGGGDIKAKSDLMHNFVRKGEHGPVTIKTKPRKYGVALDRTFIPIIEENQESIRKSRGKKRSLTGFKWADETQIKKSGSSSRSTKVKAIQRIIRKNPKASQKELSDLGGHKLKLGWNKVQKLIVKYDGKHWQSVKHRKGKLTYVPIQKKPE
jgi:AAA domain